MLSVQVSAIRVTTCMYGSFHGQAGIPLENMHAWAHGHDWTRGLILQNRQMPLIYVGSSRITIIISI